MNRVIKFRAWNIKAQMMVDLHKLTPLALDPALPVRDGLYLPFEPENFILMQFTGLHDRNGKQIFEGDILTADKNCLWDDGRHITTVGFKDGCFISTLSGVMLTTVTSSFKPEIIGNIYENPELVGGAGAFVGVSS